MAMQRNSIQNGGPEGSGAYRKAPTRFPGRKVPAFGLRFAPASAVEDHCSDESAAGRIKDGYLLTAFNRRINRKCGARRRCPHLFTSN